MTRQDVPKLTGTPRRPRRAEPPAPTASRFPCRSLFRQDSRVPRVPPAILVVRECRARALVTGGDRRVFFRFRVTGRFFFFSARRGTAAKRR